MKKISIPDGVLLAVKIISTVLITILGPILALVGIILIGIMGFDEAYGNLLACLSLAFFPLLLGVIWSKKKRIISLVLGGYVLVFGILFWFMYNNIPNGTTVVVH